MGVVDFGVEFVVDFLGEDLKKNMPKVMCFRWIVWGESTQQSGESIKDSDPRFFASKRSADPKTRHFPIPEIL